jgi:hypothetical protein
MTIKTVLKCARSCASSLLAIAFVLASSAPAQATTYPTAPIAVAAMTPADGSVITTTSLPFQASITTSGFPTGTIGTVIVEITTQNVAGQDGSLADDNRVGFWLFGRSDANPAIYSGLMNTGPFWASTPGTYYWQASTLYADPTLGLETLLSPVFTIVVAAPPPPPAPPSPPPAAPVPVATGSAPAAPAFRMTLADLAYDLPRAIVRHDRKAGNLKRSCTRLSRVAFRCKVGWRDLRFVYAGTLRLTDKGSGVPRSTFVGARANIACVQKRGLKACVKPWRW